MILLNFTSWTASEGQECLPKISLFLVFSLANMTFKSLSLSKNFYPLSKRFWLKLFWEHSNPKWEYLRTKFDTRHTKNQKPKNTNKLPW